ncbi:MAG TPA: hypothetical protein VM238_05815 [Phycisphaerae bacterium]|nr:hypothetical protein [Phycisphaerae bacterium]
MRSLCLALALAAVTAADTAQARDFFVSPQGTPGGDGAKDRPWDLGTALSHPEAVKPGDTIWLLGGAYRGAFKSRLKGASDAPITVRQAPGERATIDCRSDDPKQRVDFVVEGEHARYWGFEIMSSDPDRWSDAKGSHPPEGNRGGVTCHGSHIAFINLVVHDGSCGFGWWSSGEGGEIYGCLIYNNGWDAPDRGHGHAIYAQNKSGTKRIVDNILFNQFSYGVHVYGSSRASLNGFHIEGNASFNNGAAKSPTSLTPGILVGGGSPSERIVVRDNFTWSTGHRATALMLGYGANNKDAVVTGNYFVGGTSLRKWERLDVTGNTFIAAGANPTHVEPPPADLDLAAANTVLRGRPTGVKVIIRPNRYEPGRANAIVYNWDQTPEVEVDLGGVLKRGMAYRIVSAQDFFGKPVAGGTFDGKPVRLPMRPCRAPPPAGKPDYVPPATGPEFNVFVVLPTP